MAATRSFASAQELGAFLLVEAGALTRGAGLSPSCLQGDAELALRESRALGGPASVQQ
jgi:hypothetical protein